MVSRTLRNGGEEVVEEEEGRRGRKNKKREGFNCAGLSTNLLLVLLVLYWLVLYGAVITT